MVEQEENLLSGQWGAMAANDCLQLEKGQEMATKYIFEELIERHEMGNEDNIKLMKKSFNPPSEMGEQAKP